MHENFHGGLIGKHISPKKLSCFPGSNYSYKFFTHEVASLQALQCQNETNSSPND